MPVIGILTILAVLFFALGLIFLVVNFLSEEMETKGWGMFFLIAAAAMLVVKYCLEHPELVNGFLRLLK